MEKQKRYKKSPAARARRAVKASALIDTRVIYCGDNLAQFRKLPDASVEWLKAKFILLAGLCEKFLDSCPMLLIISAARKGRLPVL